MRVAFGNLRLSSKLIAPLLLVNVLFLGVISFGARELISIEKKSSRIVEHVDPALFVAARVNQTAQRLGYLVYRILSYRSGTVEEDQAAAEFPLTLAAGYRLLEEAAVLHPEKASDFGSFRSRFDTLGAILKDQADLAVTTNGFGLGTKDDAADLDKSATIARAMVDVDKQVDAFVQNVTMFMNGVQASNAHEAGELKADSQSAVSTMIVVGLIAVVGGIGVSVWLTSSTVVRPLTRLAGSMNVLAGGDLKIDIGGRDRRDEIGLMARAVQVFKEDGLRLKTSEAEAERTRVAIDQAKAAADAERAKAAAEQSDVVNALATGLERLSGGQLTFRIEQPFVVDYESLRVDFNKALAKLEETMTLVAGNAATIRSGTAEISSASDDLSRRTEQQAASLEETAAALDEITATVKKTSDGSIHARTVVASAKSDAEHSGTVVGQAIEAMSAIEQSAQKVTQIIGVIDEIAFQTNLLALNAGVEAARAGEAGRGFAVVASEVRALAQRSAEAAKEIKALISTSSQQVSTGVDLVNETGDALKRIVSQVAEINAVVSDIATSTQEQATALQEVNTAINQMDQVTQQNAAMVEQSTAASKNLASETEQLGRLIGQFQLGRHAARTGSTEAPPRTKLVSNKVAALKTVGMARAAREGGPATQSWEEF